MKIEIDNTRVRAEECYLCLRISPEKALEYAHKVWPEPLVARHIATEASKIIQETYSRDPTLFCGRATTSILAALFYLLAIESGLPRTQREIAEALDITEATVGANSRFILSKVERFRGIKLGRTPLSSKVKYICPRCNSFSRDLDAIKFHLGDHGVVGVTTLKGSDFDVDGHLMLKLEPHELKRNVYVWTHLKTPMKGWKIKRCAHAPRQELVAQGRLGGTLQGEAEPAEDWWVRSLLKKYSYSY